MQMQRAMIFLSYKNNFEIIINIKRFSLQKDEETDKRAKRYTRVMKERSDNLTI